MEPMTPEQVAISQAETSLRAMFARFNESMPAAKPALLDRLEKAVREEREHDSGRFKLEPPPPAHPSVGQ